MSMLGLANMSHVCYQGRNYLVKRAYKELAASATTEIVAAVTGKKLLVLGLFVGPGGAGSPVVTLKSKTTAISAAHFIEEGGTLTLLFPAPWFITAAAEALNGTESGAIKAAVQVLYAEVD